MDPDRIKFLVDQFKESGAHARHLENLRAQHMAFFFTVLLTSVGVAASTLREQTILSLTTETRIAVAIWLWILIVLAMLVLTRIKKLGYAHAIHSRLIIWSRNTIVNDHQYVSQMFGDLGDSHVLARSRIFSVQFANEAVIVVALAVLDLALAAWLYFCGSTDNWRHMPWAVLSLASLPLALFQMAIYYMAGVGNSEEVASPELKAKSRSCDVRDSHHDG